MKRITVNLIILCLLLCAGCASQEKEDGLMVGVETDYAAAIMVEGGIAALYEGEWYLCVPQQ